MKDGKVQRQDDVPIKLPEQRQLLSILMKLWKTGGQPDFRKRSMYIPQPKKEYRKKHTTTNQSHRYCMEAGSLFWKGFKD